MPDFSSFQERLDGLQFIRQKTLDGDWIHLTGAIDALNDDLVYAPANGKTFFLYSAKIVITNQPGSASAAGFSGSSHAAIVKAVLKIDTVVEDTTQIGTQGGAAGTNNSAATNSASAWGTVGDGRFDVTGLSLVGNGIKEVAIENVLDAGDANATLTGWIEDT